LIYVGLTFLETILLTFAGMSFFDAINNSMSNIASGGFSSKNESIGFWNDNPLIQYIVIFFMFLAGTNFILIYFGLTGKFKKIFQDTEFKWYVSFICAFVFISTLILFFQVNLSSTEVYHPEVLGKFESSFRHSLFQVVAIVTTTGFVTGDFISWTPFFNNVVFWYNVSGRIFWFYIRGGKSVTSFDINKKWIFRIQKISASKCNFSIET